MPLFHNGDAEKACGILAAVAEGAAGICEFTNRGDHAIDVFKAFAQHCRRQLPQMILGAGSIVDDATAALFIAHGADFIVGPSYDERVAGSATGTGSRTSPAARRPRRSRRRRSSASRS